jgi:hypothetical protein
VTSVVKIASEIGDSTVVTVREQSGKSEEVPLARASGEELAEAPGVAPVLVVGLGLTAIVGEGVAETAGVAAALADDPGQGAPRGALATTVVLLNVG